jgi:hypothetical protein
MSFNGQPNMFFGKIINVEYIGLHVESLHMWLAPKAKHFEPIKHKFFVKSQNFKTLKSLYGLIFHSMHMYFHRRRHVFVVQKLWNQFYDFMHSFLFLLKKM